MSAAADRPRGRADVVAALLDAATRLFAERGPAAVSLRDVARGANVNLGLIHRYIGSKHDLLAAVLAARPGFPAPTTPRSPEEIVDIALELMTTDAAYARIVLRAALDGFDVASVQPTFPLLERVAKAARSDLPKTDADARVAVLTTAALAFQTVAPVLLSVLKLRQLSGEELRDALRPALLDFIQSAPTTS
jgi:AcrR family transcriptional regulator